jgi:hypothetical protein
MDGADKQKNRGQVARISVFMTFIANSEIPPHIGGFLDLVPVNFSLRADQKY